MQLSALLKKRSLLVGAKVTTVSVTANTTNRL